MDSEHNDGARSAHEAPVAGAGPQLRSAREGLRLELAHIAAETRIPLRHLEAIERGNFEALPSRAYAIGFARTFATAVGLDPAVITDVVRGELADGSMRRTMPASAMEPGDPARLPSSGLAWAGAAAALLLAVGAFAFYNSQFGAGTVPGPLLADAPAVAAPTAAGPNAAAQAGVTGGDVVLTALEEGVWLRLYEQGGDRLIERTLKQGETVLVPAEAVDPRINTGRPDALAISVGGKPVAKLSDRPTTLSGAPVSAAALLARTSARTDSQADAQPNLGVGDVALVQRPSAIQPAAPSTVAASVGAAAAAGTANSAITAPVPAGN